MKRQRQNGARSGRRRQGAALGSTSRLEARPKRPAGACQQHLDRPGGDVEAVRHLDQSEAVHVLQQHGGALSSGQITQGGLKDPVELRLLERVLPAREVRSGGKRCRAPRHGAQMVVAAVHRESIEPRPQHHLALLRHALIGSDQHVLGDVLGVGHMLDQAERQAVDAGRVLLVQAGKSGRGLAAQARDEPGIGAVTVARLGAAPYVAQDSLRSPHRHRPRESAQHSSNHQRLSPV